MNKILISLQLCPLPLCEIYISIRNHCKKTHHHYLVDILVLHIVLPIAYALPVLGTFHILFGGLYKSKTASICNNLALEVTYSLVHRK